MNTLKKLCSILPDKLNASIQSVKAASVPDDSKKQLTQKVISALQVVDTKSPFENLVANPVDIHHFSQRSQGYIGLSRKEVSREKKHKWVSTNRHERHFEKVVVRFGRRLGSDLTLNLLHSMGRGARPKEYISFIEMCVKQARYSKDVEVSQKKIGDAFQIINLMLEQGHELVEATYSPLLLYFIDMGMVEDCQAFCELLRSKNLSSHIRLHYYEMLFWSRVSNEDKIRELCTSLSSYDARDKSIIAVNYMSALFETGYVLEPLQLLEGIDIKELDKEAVTSVFKLLGLGGLTSDSYADKLVLACKSNGYGAEDVCEFILNYVTNIPYLSADDIIMKFKYLHKNLEVLPTSVSYAKLIVRLCGLHKVHAALDLVKEVLEAGMTLGRGIVHSLLQACDESGEFNLVSHIYPLIRQHNLKLNIETFLTAINLSVKIKDFEGAYNMLKDIHEMNLKPTASLYNVIILGYFREKNFEGPSMVLKQMKLANVEPDAQTFSYLISFCDSEEDIIKCCEEMKSLRVAATKQVYTALINAYAKCGQFDKAKQVALENGKGARSDELKNVLVTALASNKQVADAIAIYDEIEARDHLDDRATQYLIECIQSEGQLSRLLQLLNNYRDRLAWVDGCCRVIIYCVRHRYLSPAIDLLKQLKDELSQDERTLESVITQAFVLISDSELGKTDIQFGLKLLGAIKEDLGLSPARRDLELLLAACVDAKDSDSARLVWKEHRAAGLPYNVLSYLRMYQALLASGEHEDAEKMLSKITSDDPHVHSVIDACKATVFLDTLLQVFPLPICYMIIPIPDLGAGDEKQQGSSLQFYIQVLSFPCTSISP